MDLKLNGKTAFITGSTAGIGAATARTLAAEGTKVIINGRDEAKTAKAAAGLRDAGEVLGVHGDLSTADGVQATLTRLEAHGPIDILINNAGIFEPKPFFEIPDEDWQRFFDINVMSGVRLARALLPGMRARGWGRVIFISSESGLSIPNEMIHYGMTKTAQLALVRGLAKEMRGSGVTINAVLPGPTWTEGVEDFVEKMAAAEGVSKDQMKKDFVPNHRPNSLIQRFAEPQEVADMIAYLVSPHASITTGAAIRVEGGLVDSLG